MSETTKITAVARGIRTPQMDLELYSGSSLRTYREFIRVYENAFDLTLENFPNEKDKVMWAMQFL
ncbi:hypothetical protein M433DRAFT_8886 [Acidomyces richmondensis BFW]|nr:hypothetical protein M433DRAFT_8886 [Acidomyces richmondensis BFW]